MRTIQLKWTAVACGMTVLLLVALTIHVHTTGHVTEKDDTRDPVVVNIHKKAYKADAAKLTLQPCEKASTKTVLVRETKNEKQIVNLENKLIAVAKLIKQAKTHVRGTKTGDALKETINKFSDILKIFDLDFNNVTSRKTTKSKNICPEVYNGTTSGYPFFYKGFEVTKCSYGRPLETLITIVLLNKDTESYSLPDLIQDIRKYNKNVQIVVGIVTSAKNDELEKLTQNIDNLQIKPYSKKIPNGQMLNDLISSIKSEYTLIAPDITTFNEDSRLDRLIREIESLKLRVVAGATRNTDGLWKRGCYQRAYKNYTMTFWEGYDESVHECILCDHVEGPFVVRTAQLMETQFDSAIEESRGVFEDFFIRLGGEIAVCADSMFYTTTKFGQSIASTNNRKSTDTGNSQSNISNWKSFMKKYQLYKLIYGLDEFISECVPGQYDCFSGTGYAVTPCCLKELADMVKLTMQVCDDNNIICELQEGTLLGAVKLQKVLPWERDADLTFLTSNYTAFTNIAPLISKRGYSFVDGGALWCCVDNRTAGGKLKVNSAHWHIELYGQHIMDSEMLLADHKKQTKLLLNGQWVGVPRNPGWHARNRYAHEIYAHAQHWLATGKSSGWIIYKTNQFTKCLNPGSHNCLDRFNADGNMHFIDPIP